MSNSGKRPHDSAWMAILAALAFIVWGLWVNWEYGWTARIQVALTQGAISLVSTYYAAELVVWLARKFEKSQRPLLWTGSLSYLMIYALIWMVHVLAGTPELLNTMLPGMITGVVFCFGYGWRVIRYRNRE